MKKLLVLLLIASPLLAQEFVDSPRYMVMDTLNVNSRVTRDIYFNADNSPRGFNSSAGSVDIDIYAVVTSTIETLDTMVVEAYGLKRKLLGSTASASTLMVGDSTRVGTIPLTNESIGYTFESFALDALYTNFEMYDGVRLVYKKGGSDADSLTVYSNARIYKVGK